MGGTPPAYEQRAFANLSDVMAMVRDALPGAIVQAKTTWGHAPICTQARWVQGATVVLSAHGAHLTNALWMARGALLVEVMPWGMWSYEGYRGLMRGGGVLHTRILSNRPPPSQPHWRDNATAGGAPVQEYDEGRCESREGCRRFYRACSALYFGRQQLCEALTQHVAAARQPASLCMRKWASR